MADEQNDSSKSCSHLSFDNLISNTERPVDEVTTKAKGKKRGPKPIHDDPKSVARREREMKRKNEHRQKETEEERQKRLAAQREYIREYNKNLPVEEKERRRKMTKEAKPADFYKEHYKKLVMTQTEEERTKWMEYRRIYQRKKRMLRTEEELSEQRRRDAEFKRKERWLETEEQRKARLEHRREQARKKRARETPEEREERRKLNNERSKQERMNETPEQRQRRLERGRRSLQKINENMTPEKLEARRQYDRERRKNLTEEQRQRRNEAARLADVRRRRNETPEQRAERLAIDEIDRRSKMMQMTEAEREARLEQERERVAKKRMQETEVERKERQERRRLYNKRYFASRRKSRSSGECTGTGTPQPSGSQGNAEASETVTRRPGRSAKATAGSNIRQQLEQETPEAVLNVSDESTDALDNQNSFNESDEIVSDSNAVNCRTTESSGNESECSMTLAEKWGLRPLVVRLERIDVAEFIQKIKQESAPKDDSCAVKVKRTRKRMRSVAAPSARITRWFKAISPSA